MEDSLQIIVYILAGIAWAVASVVKANKKEQAKRKVMPPSSDSTVFVDQEFEFVPEKEEIITPLEKLIKPTDSYQDKTAKLSRNKQKEIDTFLGRNPYLDSVEHRGKKKKAAKMKLLVPDEVESGTSFDVAEIDWTKAVIYSEILRPRF